MATKAAQAALAKIEREEKKKPKLTKKQIGILLESARGTVEKEANRSALFDRDAEAALAEFGVDEVSLGRILGKGGFSVVNEVRAFNLNDGTPEQKKDDEDAMNPNSRQAMSDRCIRNGDARYAVKKLRPEMYENGEDYLLATVCLALEAKFLAIVSHPHIIRMRAVGSGGPYQDGYFIVLDRLYGTLEEQIPKWKKQKGGSMRRMIGGKKKKNELLCEQVYVAHDISSALGSLHDKMIVYRDLKPENAGFDVRGDIKLFDLGLAKELHPDDCVGEKLYKLTVHAGSLRYMAPEVALSKPYYLSADVYSFSMLLWEMLALEEPFKSYSVRIHTDRVFKQGYRPAIDPNWPEGVGALMKRCWHATPTKRPTFQEVTDILYEEAQLLSPDSDVFELDVSNKTQKSMRSFRGL